jgi:hypothetical protein
MAKLIDSINPEYTGIDLWDSMARLVRMSTAEKNRERTAQYLELVANALKEYREKGTKQHDPMPQPPGAYIVDVIGREIRLIESDEPLVEFVDYPEPAKRVQGVEKVGELMGHPDFPERRFAAGDTMPMGHIALFEGKRYKRGGRFSPFGGMVPWYDLVVGQ